MLDRAIITTAINPGLAGAPLFDPSGALLGLVSLGMTTVGRYSLAIPIDLYLERREAMDEGDRRRRARAWLGFYPQGFDGGVVISGLVARGPAEAAGLQTGDLVLSVDGEPVTTLRELYGAIWKKGPGEALRLQVLRDSAIRVVEVTGGDRVRVLSMSILKVARIGHPAVRARAVDVAPDRITAADTQRLIDDMIETMHEYDGVGLAAPQVHVGLRLAVIEVSEEDERAEGGVPADRPREPRGARRSPRRRWKAGRAACRSPTCAAGCRGSGGSSCARWTARARRSGWRRPASSPA